MISVAVSKQEDTAEEEEAAAAAQVLACRPAGSSRRPCYM
jgi:hypothetical protein